MEKLAEYSEIIAGVAEKKILTQRCKDAKS